MKDEKFESRECVDEHELHKPNFFIGRNLNPEPADISTLRDKIKKLEEHHFRRNACCKCEKCEWKEGKYYE